MEEIIIYDFKNVEKLISPREGETKFGEKISFIEHPDDLDKHPAEYVLFGIPEDIGVRANYGKPGASQAWQACLKALLNIQYNEFTDPQNLILLGEINCHHLMKKASNIDKSDPNYFSKLGDLVARLDDLVSEIVRKIISTGKIPVIVGGGHNNAYATIKGTSLTLKEPVNVLNIDAHTDLRKMDYRHSGNGFSFARTEGFLGNYFIFGLHQNYTPQYIFEQIKTSEKTSFKLFEDLIIQHKKMETSFELILGSVNHAPFGLEIDCDSIKNFPSSAQSPIGFSIEEIRNFIKLAKENNCKYLHLCEAAPQSQNKIQTGKALSYFITDFMAKSIIL